MWKHKLQEALAEHDNLPPIILEAREKLNEAISFYLGSATDISHLAKPLVMAKTSALCPSDLRMPYDTCLFELDYNGETSNQRSLTLIYRKEGGVDSYIILPFLFNSSSEEKWQYSALYGEFCFDSAEITGRYCDTDEEEHDISKYASFFITGCSVSHITLLLLSCKNVSTSTVPAPARLNKKRTLRNKFPISEYKILEVHPQASRRAADNKHHGPAKGMVRVHLCRGHFKEYTADKPLMGKATGRYWWQPTVRGEKKRGVLNKDYAIRG
ncbi:MAG: hypothetical protein QM579_02900 [Desulfovibrio sp.]|uniref:hypothetical protein n=1 Tax=Desulfovibrio sp. TaxID=885 RepID=UPI0039E68E96